ncbi:MAG: UDP-N-acetylglucosamine 4,6-dehydratase family protein [Methanoregula sp.]
MKNYYKGKKILVTGGVGSIGNQLVRKLLALDPEIIRILDNNETGLFDLEQELKSDKLRILIGDIRDKERLIMAMDDIDIVFHTSALKHVPICEFNPFDAVKTNVLGTQNVLEAALINEVEKVINVSTDKAVNPTNVMGATKLLAERLTISANHYKGNKRTVFSSVRFGNVLNSRGSVIPVFKKQIETGGPVTVTDKDMTRFFMDIPAAVNLILKAGELAQGREVFILKMPALKIIDLAEVMIMDLSRVHGHDPEKIRINYIGTRCGEKLFEELMTESEAARALDRNDMYIVLPETLPFEEHFDHPLAKKFRKSTIAQFSSHNTRMITKKEISALLRNFSI